MRVNASFVKDRRSARSWTQQHLADACDVSLRTIQRVENLGVASPETVMGLCSVLEVTQDELIMPPVETPERGFLTPQVIAFAVVATMAGALLGAITTYLMLNP